MYYEYGIVITGGIATGKSTFCHMLQAHGFYIIDADNIAHRALDNAFKDIINQFGNEYIYYDDDNTARVNRKLLGNLVFNNTSAKQQLEQLMHPKIKSDIELLAITQEQKRLPYFIDIPLFFERRQDYKITKHILIYTPLTTQLKRLQQRDQVDEQTALSRINAQMSIEKKKDLAYFFIDNCGSLAYLQKNCDALVKQIKQGNF